MPSCVLLSDLHEDALALVFSFLPAAALTDGEQLSEEQEEEDSCVNVSRVCRRWYALSCYPGVLDSTLLSRRVRHWMRWLLDQPREGQTLAHLLAQHPVLARCNEQQERDQPQQQQLHDFNSVELAAVTHPTAVGMHARNAASNSSERVPRVSVAISQLLNLVEILCSARSGGRPVRSTRESHLLPMAPGLLAPLEHFAIERLDLSGMGACVDAPLCRALCRLPSLSALALRDCRLLTDSAVAALLHPYSGLRTLRHLDLSDNAQLKGAGWRPTEEELSALADADGADAAEHRPATLSSLRLRGCRGLSARSFPFSWPLLLSPYSLEELDISGVSGAFLASFFARGLHRLSSLRVLRMAGAGGWSASKQLTDLIRSGRLMLEEDDASAALLSGGVDALALRGDLIEGLPVLSGLEPCSLVNLKPLEQLCYLDASGIGRLPESMVALLLLHCTPQRLTYLDLSGCPSSAAVDAGAGAALRCSSVLRMLHERAGQSLRTLKLDWIAEGEIDDEEPQQQQRPPVIPADGGAGNLAATLGEASLLFFPALRYLSLRHWRGSLSSLCSGAGGLLRAGCCPLLEELDLSGLSPGAAQLAAVEQQRRQLAEEAQRVRRWNEEQRARRQADRAAIRAHAAAQGLPLPSERSDDDEEESESGVTGNGVPSVAVAPLAAAAAPAAGAPSVAAGTSAAGFAAPAASAAAGAAVSPSSPSLGACLASLRHLRVVSLRGARGCCSDADLLEWSAALRRQQQEDDAASHPCVLERVDVSECAGITTNGVRAVLDAVQQQQQQQQQRFPPVAATTAATATSSVPSSPRSVLPSGFCCGSLGSFTLLALECPSVSTAALPPHLQAHVRASLAWEL